MISTKPMVNYQNAIYDMFVEGLTKHRVLITRKDGVQQHYWLSPKEIEEKKAKGYKVESAPGLDHDLGSIKHYYKDQLSESTRLQSRKLGEKLIASLPEEQQKIIHIVNESYNSGNTTSKFFKHNDKYIPERIEVHKKIINDLLDKYSHVQPNDKPEVIMLAGLPGSGKTSVVAASLDLENYVYLNSDDIKVMIPGYKGFDAGLVHDESTDILEKMIQRVRTQKKNLIIDATFKNSDKATNHIRLFKKKGFHIKLKGIVVPPEIAINRAFERYQHRGRWVPLDYIAESFGKIAHSLDTIRHLVHEYEIYDNSGEKGETPKLISSSL